MSFNCPDFIKEFKSYVKGLNVGSIMEIGGQTDELRRAVGASTYDELERSDLVYSVGWLQHLREDDILECIQSMAECSNEFVLNYVPNSNCLAYMNRKKKAKAGWKNEKDFTLESLAKMHEDAGLEVVETGTAGKEWAKRFGKEPSEPYLVYCLARKKVGRDKWQKEKSDTFADIVIPEKF